MIENFKLVFRKTQRALDRKAHLASLEVDNLTHAGREKQMGER